MCSRWPCQTLRTPIHNQNIAAHWQMGKPLDALSRCAIRSLPGLFSVAFLLAAKLRDSKGKVPRQRVTSQVPQEPYKRGIQPAVIRAACSGLKHAIQKYLCQQPCSLGVAVPSQVALVRFRWSCFQPTGQLLSSSEPAGRYARHRNSTICRLMSADS